MSNDSNGADQSDAADVATKTPRRRRAEQVLVPGLTTDVGNAHRFWQQHSERVRYCPAWKQWLDWDNRRWRVDETGRVVRLAKLTARRIWKEIADAHPADQEELYRWAKRSESAERIAAMLKLAQVEEPIPAMPDNLDTNPWMFNVLNGTVDLRNGQLYKHDPGQLITKLAAVTYEPLLLNRDRIACPKFMAFLFRIMDGNEGLITFLQRLAGYSLTGLTTEQCFALLYGGGSNGKTTLLEILRGVIGEYAREAAFDTFLARRNEGVRDDIAELRGSRFVSASEPEGGKRLSEALVKKLTGNEMMRARNLYQPGFQFRPTFKLWFASNHKPDIKGTDLGMWRRVRLIPFEQTITDEEKDKHLADRIAATETSGVLAWMVRGCLDWQRHGLGTPPEVTAATDDYKSEMDTLGAFFEQACVKGDAVSAVSSDLYNTYRTWCALNGETPDSQRTFSLNLQHCGLKAKKNGAGQMEWKGIGILAR